MCFCMFIPSYEKSIFRVQAQLKTYLEFKTVTSLDQIN